MDEERRIEALSQDEVDRIANRLFVVMCRRFAAALSGNPKALISTSDENTGGNTYKRKLQPTAADRAEVARRYARRRR